jgi:hypothetical protein
MDQNVGEVIEKFLRLKILQKILRLKRILLQLLATVPI